MMMSYLPKSKQEKEKQDSFEHTLNLSHISTDTLGQPDYHKRAQSLTFKSAQKQSGFKVFKKQSVSGLPEDGENSMTDNSFSRINNSFSKQDNSFSRQDNIFQMQEGGGGMHNSCSLQQASGIEFQGGLSSRQVSTLMNQQDQSIICNSTHGCFLEQVYKLPFLYQNFQSQSNRIFASAPQKCFTEMSVKESAEFGGNLKSRAALTEIKKLQSINDLREHQTDNSNQKCINNNNNKENPQRSSNNSYQQKTFLDQSLQPAQLVMNQQEMISSILEKMQNQLTSIESRLDKFEDKSLKQSKEKLPHNLIEESQLIINILERIQSIESRFSSFQDKAQANMDSLNKNFINFQRLNQTQIESKEKLTQVLNLENEITDFEKRIRESISNLVIKYLDIEKKVDSFSLKRVQRDKIIEDNYQNIIQRLDKIDIEFSNKLFDVQTPFLNDKTFNTYCASDSLKDEIDYQEIVRVLSASSEIVSKVKWLSEEMQHVKHRQDKFVMLLSEISGIS